MQSEQTEGIRATSPPSPALPHKGGESASSASAPSKPIKKAITGNITARDIAIIAIFIAFALTPLLAKFGAEGYIVPLVTRVIAFAIAALSLDLILGYGALASFGHAAFVGIGAYAVGILSAHGIDDLFLQIIVAVVASALFALATGALSLRTKGVYFIMITLAFGQMIYFLAVSLSAYGGDDGMSLSGRSTLFGVALFKGNAAFLYLSLACLIGCYALCRAIVGSRFGRVLRGAKENAVRMEAIGFSPFRYQLAAYVIAGVIASLAGVLLANQTGFVSPAFMTWQRSGDLLVMTVLGGVGTLAGGIIGAGAFLLLEEILSDLTQHWKMIFGPMLVLVVLFARGGILGLFGRLRGGRDG